MRDLEMKTSALDPFIFYKIVDSVLEVIQVTQVNETIGSGNDISAI